MRSEPFLTDDDHELRQALSSADAAMPAALPEVKPADLLAAVRRRHRRVLHTRLAATAAMVITLAAVVTRPSTPRLTASRQTNVAIRPPATIIEAPPPTSPAPTTASLRAEIASLQREAALSERIVEGVRRAEQVAQQQAELAAAARAWQIDVAAQEASRSAAISLQYATMVEQESRDPQRARHEYERVRQRFPGTTWAALAASSLTRLSHSGDPKL
jgi:hypothetical protein